MKNLKEICKEFNMYQWDEIPSKYNKNNLRSECFKSHIPDELKNFPGMETGVFWRCETDDEGTTREYSYVDDYPAVLVKFGDIVAQFSPQQQYNDKKASFFFPHFLQRKYNGLSRYILKRAVEDLKKPNYIGIFTDKKIKDWLKYVQQYGEALEEAYIFESQSCLSRRMV